MESEKSPTEPAPHFTGQAASAGPQMHGAGNDRLFPGDISFLASKAWWQSSFATAWAFAPFCVKPAAVLAIAHILLLCVLHLLSRPSLLTAYMPADMTAEALRTLLLIAVGSICALVIGLAMSLWALTAWANTLTAFARACLTQRDQPDAAAFRQALTWAKGQSGYVTKVWLYGSIFIVMPLFPAAFLLAFKLVFSSEWIQLGVPRLDLPQWLYLAVSFAASNVSFSYLFALLIYSAISPLTPFGTAWKALQEGLRAALRLGSVTAVVMVVNYGVSAPHALLIATPIPDMVLQNLLLASMAQIWLSISSCFLWPWSVLPYCRLAGVRTP